MKKSVPSRADLMQEVARLRGELTRLRAAAADASSSIPAPLRPLPAEEPPEAQLEKIFTALPDVVMTLNSEGRYLKVLARKDSLLVARAKDLEGNLLQNILPPETSELCLRVISAALQTGKDQSIEYQLETLGGWKWFEGRISPLREPDETLDTVICIVRDVTERKNTELAIRSTLEEKELLLRELYHRVNNTLQLIISLLQLQADFITDENTRAIFCRNRNRIASMAIIHEILYNTDDLTRVDFGRYLEILAGYLFEQYSVDPEEIELETDFRDLQLNINTAIPCGLILNELLVGSLDHLPSAPPRGVIRIEIRSQAGQRAEISFARRGENFPDLSAPSLSLELIRTLSDQLGGKLETDRGEWTTWKINFSLTDNQPPAGENYERQADPDRGR